MSNGRHFNPPTPAYRPRDPFSSFEPRSAERVPSCETTRPPPSRPRPVRVEPPVRKEAGELEPLPASVAPAALTGSGTKELVTEAKGAPSAGEGAKAQPPLKEVAHQAPQQAEARTPKPAHKTQEAPVPVKTGKRHVEPQQQSEARPDSPGEGGEKGERKTKAEPPAMEPTMAESAAPAAEVPAAAPAALHSMDPEVEEPAAGHLEPAAAPEESEEGGKSRRKARGKTAAVADTKASRAQTRRKVSAPIEEEEPVDAAPADETLVLGEGEEIRVCEWEKCGKRFAVKTSGRTVVRRFCSGTCRGRASEARTGKRPG